MTAKEKKMAGVKKHNEAVKQKKADDVKKAINKLLDRHSTWIPNLFLL